MSEAAPFFAALSVIGLAELGDKTQLLTFGLATRYPFWSVIGAVAAATGLLMALAVAGGGLINHFIPQFYLQLCAGIVFLGFGLWTLLGGEKAEAEARPRTDRHPFWLVFSVFFLAELGDKTQLATLTLSARYGAPLAVWLGATLGMVGVNVLSVLLGRWTGKHLPEKYLKYIGAAVFIGFGLWTCWELWR